MPEFDNYEDEVKFWDNLDTADFMEDDGQWFRFETSNMDKPEPKRIEHGLNGLSRIFLKNYN